MAPRPATPLEILITYRPAERPATRKSVTDFINPRLDLTEINMPAITRTTIDQSKILKFIFSLLFHLRKSTANNAKCTYSFLFFISKSFDNSETFNLLLPHQ